MPASKRLGVSLITLLVVGGAWCQHTVAQSSRRPLPIRMPVFHFGGLKPAKLVGGYRAALATKPASQVSQVQYAAPLEPSDLQHMNSVPLVSGSPALVRSAGCCCGRCPPPLGSAVNAYFDTHIDQGIRAQLVLYHYDFYNGSRQDRSQLNAAGKRKLAGFRHLLESSPHPLIVQRVDDDMALSAARRLAVVRFMQSELGHGGDTHVVVGYPPSPGTRGAEAVELDRSQQTNLRTQGITSGAGQNAGSNFSRGAQR